MVEILVLEVLASGNDHPDSLLVHLDGRGKKSFRTRAADAGSELLSHIEWLDQHGFMPNQQVDKEGLVRLHRHGFLDVRKAVRRPNAESVGTGKVDRGRLGPQKIGNLAQQGLR